MPLDLIHKKQIMDLLVLILEGQADRQEQQSLRDLLDASEEAREYYLKAVMLAECIRKTDWQAEGLDEEADACDGLDLEFWNALAEQEKTAVAVVPEKTDDHLPVKPLKADFRPAPRRINKLSLVTLIVSSAALIFLLAMVYFAPRDVRTEVATLTDSMRAKWADASIKDGERFMVRSGEILLQEGFARLQFDNNARLTIEGPAKFEILSEDRVRLHYGQLYSIVPTEAIGFSVATHNALVIDLGTEFGVQVDMEGNTELHVNRGKTMLVSGEKKDKTGVEILQGAARKVSAVTSELSEIPCQEAKFIRDINSRTRMIWRGQQQLSLADLVGGGNGWGTGKTEVGIDPLTGRRGGYSGYDREGPGRYLPLSADRYLDGIFVPNGRATQVVSTDGHLFEECPPTNNIFFVELVNGSAREMAQAVNPGSTLQLGGRPFGTPDYPSLFMHANLGVTFDLEAIRADLPRGRIDRFTADAGLSSDIDRQANAVIWVLVDGKVRFTASVRSPEEVLQIEVPLTPADRFLTLVATDGEDEDIAVGGGRASDSDWCVFGRPTLELSTP